MTKRIPYSHQSLDQEDINAVVAALKSDHLTQGPVVEQLEQALAEYCGAGQAVVFSSGTAALHAAYFAAGVRAGSEVVTSPVTFMATANAALYLGGRPVFVDVEPETGNIDPDLIEAVITENTRLIVPVHYGGRPVDLKHVSDIAKTKQLIVIEDACHALGARYRYKTIGDCSYSDMAVFSFHPLKSITTGEGGAVMTNNEDYARKLKMFRHHGVTKDPAEYRMQTPEDGGWYHEMQFLGFNYRLTDVQCALGVSQMRKLNAFVLRRRHIAEQYAKAFTGNPYFDISAVLAGDASAWHLYPIRMKEPLRMKKKKIFTQLQQEGLGVQVHYIPVYLQPFYQDRGYPRGLCPRAEDFVQREISLPIYPGLSDADVTHVIRAVLKVMETSNKI